MLDKKQNVCYTLYMSDKSNFDTDTIFERTSIEYLRKNNFFEKIGIFNCKFTDDINEQKAGCDLIADIEIDGQILIFFINTSI